MIVVRQKSSVFFAFIAVGSIIIGGIWFLVEGMPLWARCLASGFGFLAIAMGAWAWRTQRIGFVADRQGLWCGGLSFWGPTLIRWSDVIGVRAVRWHHCCEGDHEGLLLGLRSGGVHPLPPKHVVWYMKGLERHLGAIEWPTAVLLPTDEWDWTSSEIAERVEACLNDPSQCGELGVFTP